MPTTRGTDCAHAIARADGCGTGDRSRSGGFSIGTTMNLHRWIAALAMTGVAGPAFAQYCITNTSDPNYEHCRQQEEQWRRDEAERQRQRDAESAQEQGRSEPQWSGQPSQSAENDSALKALRARLLASPPLPPDRNPLLGRWRIANGAGQRGGDELSQLMEMLSNPGAAMCELVFGAGIVEFKADSWASNDSAGDDSLGPVHYRAQDKQVFALPDRGLPLLGFDVVDRSTIREIRLPDCVLVRVGAQPTAAAATPAARPTAGAAARNVPARSAREPIEPVSRLGRGVQLHGEKDFQPALQQLLAAAKADPDDPRVFVYLADTYAWLGMDAEARQAAERAKQLDPDAFEILR